MATDAAILDELEFAEELLQAVDKLRAPVKAADQLSQRLKNTPLQREVLGKIVLAAGRPVERIQALVGRIKFNAEKIRKGDFNAANEQAREKENLADVIRNLQESVDDLKKRRELITGNYQKADLDLTRAIMTNAILNLERAIGAANKFLARLIKG